MVAQDQIKQDTSGFAPPGQMVDIGGFNLHAVVRGEGTPTVLFEPGLGGFSLQYSRILPGVSAFTRVMAYDRAGQAWSDPSPNPRTPVFMAGELRTLLDRLGLQPPYVLVGHSFGGLLARVYNGYHPEEVAGMVLVDATSVNEFEIFPDPDLIIRQNAQGARLMKIASWFGLARPLARLSMGSLSKVLPPEDFDTFVTVFSLPKHHEAALAEAEQYRSYLGPQSEVPVTLGDLPLVVVTAGNSISGRGKVGGVTARQINEHHQEMQKDLARLSSRGEQIVIPGASHLSILAQPEYAAQVVEAIRRVVEAAREEKTL